MPSLPPTTMLAEMRLRGYARSFKGRIRPPQKLTPYVIIGITRDSAGNPLGTCVVDCFDTATDTKLATTISDSVGAYTIRLSANSGFFYCVAYKAGSPDVTGATVNFVVGIDPPGPSVPLQLDMYVDMENSTNTTTVDATIAAACTHVPSHNGDWSVVSGPILITVSTNQEKKLRNPVKIDTTQYDDATGTRSWRIKNTDPYGYMQYDFLSPKSKVSLGMAWYFSNEGVGWGTDFNFYDLIHLNGTAGEYSVLSLNNRNDRGGTVGEFSCHTSVSPFESVQKNYMDMGKWYWITMYWDGPGQLASIIIYDMATWTAQPTMTLAISNDTVQWIGIGRTDNHGTSNVDAYFYNDDLCVQFANPVFPLVP